MAMAAHPVNTRRTGSSVGPMSSSTPSWTDDLPVCHLSAIGFSTNQVYRADGGREEEHEFEDRCFHFKCDDDIYLYGVFDGHSGVHVADFVRQRLPVELLLGQLTGVEEDFAVKKILQQAFLTVEAAFFETIDPALAAKIKLKMELPEGLSDYELYQTYPDKVEKLQSLDREIIGGTSAVVALIHKEKLYVASVGDSRAVLCTREPDNSLKVRQLSIDHTIDNEDEQLRLSHLNLDVAGMQQVRGQRGLAGHPTTRSIGDYNFKGGYKDIEVLSYATSEPVIAEPEIIGGLPISGMCGFLLMYTNGLTKSMEEATNSNQLNLDLAYRVANEYQVQATLSGVAQQVVDKVVRNHHDMYLSNTERAHYCLKRDDMTMLVRNFDYPLGSAVSPLGGSVSSMSSMSGYNAVTVPFSPHRTETNLSLIIPPQNPMPPTLTHSISQTPIITGIPSVTPSSVPIAQPLFVEVNATNIPTSPSSSHTSTIESQPSSGTSTPQKYETNQTNSTGTQGSSNSDTQSSPFLFQRLSEPKDNNAQAEPDSDGYIEPYVDFTDFMKAYEAAVNESHYSQEGDKR